MTTKLPSIEKVKYAGAKALRIKFRNAGWRTVSLEGVTARYTALGPLNDPTKFAKMRVIDWGGAVGWPGDLDIGASTLWHLSEEQKPFTAKDLIAWQARNGLSNQETADALGVSPATIKNYRTGGSIPTAVAIACRAMEAEPTTLAAHYRPRKAGRPKAA